MDEPDLLTVSVVALISHYISRAPLGPASCDTEAELVEGKAARLCGSSAPRGMFAGKQNKPSLSDLVC